MKKKKTEDGIGITLTLERDSVAKLKVLAIERAFASKSEIVWTDLVREAVDRYITAVAS